MSNILLLEPFWAQSHASWAEGYKQFSNHNIQILKLEGRHWKWRMHGGAVTLAGQFQQLNFQPDLVLATDMLDVTTFQSLCRKELSEVPFALYFHENQLSYPWSPKDTDKRFQRDNHYGFIHFLSCLASDAVFFNSSYHLSSFTDELKKLLHHFPDHKLGYKMEEVMAKSKVLHLGMDLSRFDQHRAEKTSDKPLLLWNHRWEYDKNPTDFFRALQQLKATGLDFDVALLGERFDEIPPVFKEGIENLKGHIATKDYAKDFATYAQWLWKADILPVTSNQDFFGGSVIEAMYCECVPFLPNRLAYPEHAGEDWRYDSFEELISGLSQLIKGFRNTDTTVFRDSAARYRWELQAPIYDKALEKLL